MVITVSRRWLYKWSRTWRWTNWKQHRPEGTDIALLSLDSGTRNPAEGIWSSTIPVCPYPLADEASCLRYGKPLSG
ncbi:MAG: hypothetical protein ACLR6J_19300 [Parabacteroides merdae]